MTRRRPVVDCSKLPSRTKTYFQKECDINAIVARAAETGQVPVRSGGMFADVSKVQMDYREALDFVRSAQDYFWALQPGLRMRFKNDIGAFLAFLDNPANKAECVKLGLLEADKQPVKEPVQSVPPEQVVEPKKEAPKS